LPSHTSLFAGSRRREASVGRYSIVIRRQSKICYGSVADRFATREGRLYPGQYFPYSWTWGGEPLGSISVRTEAEAVVLMFGSRTSEDSEWKSV